MPDLINSLLTRITSKWSNASDLHKGGVQAHADRVEYPFARSAQIVPKLTQGP